jgi:hypothetical protein
MKAIKSVLAERRMFAHGGPAYTSAQARSYFGANPYHLENVGPGLGYAKGIFGNAPPPPGAIAANQAARQRLSRVDPLPSDAPVDEGVGPVSPPTEFGPLIDTLVTPSLPQQIAKTVAFGLLPFPLGFIGKGLDIHSLKDQLGRTAKIIGKEEPSYLDAFKHSMGKNYFNPEDQARAAQMSGLDEHSIKGMPTGLGIGDLTPLSIQEIEAQLAKAEAEVVAYEATPAFQATTMADTEAAVTQAVAAAEAVPAITMADTEAAVTQAVAAGNVPGSVPGFGGKHGMDYGLEFGFDDSGDGGGESDEGGGVGGGGAGGGDDTGDESGSASAPWRAGGFLSGTNYAHGGPVMTGLGFRPLHYQNGTGPDPIRSVLAERKMFVNGGLLALDQGQNKANGILASSESLIDAVVREAMSPQGGHTLSMDQGGVARFDIGGGPFSEMKDYPVAGKRTEIGPGSSRKDISDRYAMTPSERMLNMFPYEAVLTGSFFGPRKVREKGLGFGVDTTSLAEQAVEVPYAIVNEAARGLSQVSNMAVNFFANLTETIFKRGNQSPATKFDQISSINKLLLRQPVIMKTKKGDAVSPDQVSADINEEVKIYLGKNPDSSGANLELAVSEALYQKYELGHGAALFDVQAGTRALRTDDRHDPDYLRDLTTSDPNPIQQQDTFGSDEALYQQQVSAEAEKMRMAMTDPVAYQTYMEAFSKNPSFSAAFQRDVQASVGAVGDEDIQLTVSESLLHAQGSDDALYQQSQLDKKEEPASKVVPSTPTVDDIYDVQRISELDTGEEPTITDDLAPGYRFDPSIVQVQNSTDPKAPPLHVDRKALIAELAQKGKNVDADAQWAAFADVIKQIGQTAKGSGEVDIETLKAEMEALLPTVEDDPQMKGMHLILLGASIAGGTSSNPWTNVAQGISQQMPNIIKYRASQTAAKRSRETTIAKLAIEQKLGIQSEQRAEARKIAAEERGFAIDIQKDLFEKSIAEESYTVAIGTTIDASAINPDATGKITIPFGTSFSLTKDQMDFFSNNNIPLIPTKNLTLKDIRLAAIGTSVPDPSKITPKEWKQLSKMDEQTIFRNHLNKGVGIKYNARFPEAGAIQLYPGYDFSKSTVDNSEVLHVQNSYKRATKDHSELFTELNGLRKIALTKGMTGPERLKEQFASALRGYAGTDKDSMAYHIANSILGGGGVSTYNAFNAKARLILAKIAPILLGESGKTISDGDRVRVALALGIDIERQVNKDGTVTWLLGETPFKNILVNPKAISHAITEVQRALSRNLEDINMEMAGFYMRHNRNVPGGVWEEKGMLEDVYKQDYDWDLRAKKT